MLGHRTHQLPKHKGPAADFVLNVFDVDAIARAFPKAKARTYQEPLRVTIDGEKLTIATESNIANYRAVDDRPLNTGQFIDNFTPGDIGQMLLDPDRLAVFAKVTRDKGAGARLKFAEKGRMVLVEIGDHFVGILMPMRDAS
jgi:hypothetical protein